MAYYKENFWIWFEAIAGSLSNDPHNSDLIYELDDRIESLGPFDWEIGPVDENTVYLAISPCLDELLLDRTKEMIKHAPNIQGWKFYSSKPQKPISKSFTMLNDARQIITIDISDWQYGLQKTTNNKFDIEVHVKNIDGNWNTEVLAVEILLVNILGEEKFMSLIKTITVNEEKTFIGKSIFDLGKDIG
jgi:hypothetical protein